MATIVKSGYTYDTETRVVTFVNQPCRDCKGEKTKEYNDLCPLYHKPVRAYGGKCPHCKAKNQHSHGVIGSHVESCHTCKGTGEILPNMYASLDFSELIKYIEIKTMRGIHSADINEHYFGMGIIGGCTDYGRYITESGGNFDAVMAIVIKSMCKRAERTQAGNLLTADNKLIDSAILKLNSDGYSVFSVGAYFQRNRQ